MQYIIFMREFKNGPITHILGRVEENGNKAACSIARNAFGYEPEERYPDCLLESRIVQTLFLEQKGLYCAIKKKSGAGRNEGAISRDRDWFYVNAVTKKSIFPRMHELSKALSDVDLFENKRKNGAVMGEGSGTGYGLYAKFKTQEEAVNYIKRLGYDVSGEVKFE
jgi:hypothetical protein